MIRTRTAIAAVALVLAGALGAAAPSTVAEEAELSADARRVMDYLLEDWGKKFRSTSIPLAMANLGIEPDGALRLDIGRHFRAHPELANNLKFWGANNYILSNDEKLIAKYLLNTFRDEERLPGLPELAAAVVLPEAETAARLAFLADAGLLNRSAENELGYALADGYKGFGGPLRYNFHTVEIEGEKPFGLW